MRTRICATLSLMMIAFLSASGIAKEYLSGMEWETPAKVTPGEENSAPPSDAIVLFDGTSLDAWQGGEKWKVEGGVAVVGSGPIRTKQEFGDCQLHLEWSSPNPPQGNGQACANSGLFLMDRYEIQVLDSFSSETYPDGQAGAIYKQTPPRFNEQGELESPAYMTALHNGVLILHHFELQGDTPYDRPPRYTTHSGHSGRGPISLQEHGSPVRYRNIWIRELAPAAGKQARAPFFREEGTETPVQQEQAKIPRSG